MMRATLFLGIVAALSHIGSSEHQLSYQLVVPYNHSSSFTFPSLTVYAYGGEQRGEGLLQTFYGPGNEKQRTFLTSYQLSTVVSDEGECHTLHLESSSTVVKTKLDSSDGSVAEAYLPLPDTCLGTTYRVSTLDPMWGDAFIIIKNTFTTVFVHIVLDIRDKEASIEVDNQFYGAGQTITLKMEPNEMRVVKSASGSLGGVLVNSTGPVAVFSGNFDTMVNNVGKPNTLIDMIPPKEMAGTNYVVTLPDEASSAMLEVVSFKRNTELMLTEFSREEQEDLTMTATLKKPGRTWVATQEGHVIINASQPVMVVQYPVFAPCVVHPEGVSSSAAMTVIPSTNMWTGSYHVHPFVGPTMNNTKQTATIVIESKHTSGFHCLALSDWSDRSASLKWKRIGQTPYSTASLALQGSEVFRLSHLELEVTFQVIMTGSAVHGGGYALPAGISSACDSDRALGKGKARSLGRQKLAHEELLIRKRRGAKVPNKDLLLSRHKRNVGTTSRPDSSTYEDSTVYAPTTANVTVNTTATINYTTPFVNTTAQTNSTEDEGVSAAVVAGTAAAAGAAVAGTVAAVAAVKASAAAAAASGAGAAGAAATGATGAATAGGQAIAVGGAAGGNAAAAAANTTATGGVVSAFHGGGTMAANVAPAISIV